MDTKRNIRNISGIMIFTLGLLFSTASESHRGYYGGGWGWGLGAAAAATGLILSAPFWGGYHGYYGGYYGRGYYAPGGYYGSGYYAPYYRNVYYAPRCQVLKVCNTHRGRCWFERRCY